jgi:hypothetical protein
MTKLLQSDWLRGVQLMIFVMARGGGGEREIKTTKNQYGGEICLTNVDEFNYILAPE